MLYKTCIEKNPQYAFELIPKKPIHMVRQTLITFLVSTLDATSSKTLPFLLQSLIEANYILQFGTQKVSEFSKVVSLQLLDTPQVVILVFVITRELDGSQDWA